MTAYTAVLYIYTLMGNTSSNGATHSPGDRRKGKHNSALSTQTMSAAVTGEQRRRHAAARCGCLPFYGGPNRPLRPRARTCGSALYHSKHRRRGSNTCSPHAPVVPSTSTREDMLVAVSILALSLSLLIYHHPPSTWSAWLSREDAPGGTRDMSQDGKAERRDPPEGQQTEPQVQPDNETEPSPQTTPKAAPSTAQNGVAIPTFTLAEDDDEEEDDDDNLPPPSFPAMNSAQRASAPALSVAPSPKPTLMAPPPRPSAMAPPSKPATSSLMPPPSIKPTNLRALPTTTPSLRVPTNGPLPNRGPIPNRSPNGGLAPQATVKTPNSRGKVLLSPGHSPLDWANLQKSSSNLSGVPSLIRVPPSLLKHNNGRKGKPAWSSYEGKVYNITPYLPFHPGGEGELRRAAGKDGRKLFMEVHPWVNWDNMLGECLVGIMVGEESENNGGMGTSLDDMD